METFLIILLVWLIPAWFSIRLNLIAHAKRGLDTLDTFMIFLFVPVGSWIGLFVCMACSEGDQVRQTFFIPKKKDRSVQSKIFWHNVRAKFFRLFLVKEVQ